MATPENTKSDIASSVVALLAGAAFFLGGCAVAFGGIIKPLFLIDRARVWVETPAQIQSLGIESHGGRRGGSTLMRIRYQYEFNGQIHTSTRFSAHYDTGNRRDYDHYKPLFEAKQPITCWVASAKPTEAVIDRMPHFPEIAASSIFAFIFPSIGLLILFSAFLPSRSDPKPGDLHIPAPNTSFCSTATITALTLAYTVLIFSKLIHFFPWPWYIWLLLLPSLLLSPLCIHYYFYCKTFKGTYLDLAFPPVIGGTLSATLRIHCPLDSREQTVTLRCERHGYKNATTVWKTKSLATVFSDGETTTFSVHLMLPPDNPAGRSSYTWSLSIKVRCFGLRHTLTFEIPVHAVIPN